MNAALFLIVGVAVLLLGYIFYGRWLAKQWGLHDSRVTPAHEMEDGKDYCPAKAPVLMGHHFSSIAGAGPITGPISAAMFGWLPCVLWILVGGIFFGGVMTSAPCLPPSVTAASPSAKSSPPICPCGQSACSSSSLT